MNTISNMMPTAIDLFSGCGGISLGLQRAGFTIVCGVDNQANYLATFGHNFGSSAAILADLSSSMTPHELMRTTRLRPGELTILAGGPPCQGFSKNVPRAQREAQSNNNVLISTFLNYVDVFKPRLVLIENVAEMQNGFDSFFTREIYSRLSSSGYSVQHAVLNSADYGVPQRRRRAFFFGSRDGIKLRVPQPTHGQDRGGNFLLKPWVSVWDAIGDLPKLENGEGKARAYYSSEPHTEYQRHARKFSNRLTNHVARKLTATQFSRIKALQPGQSLKDLPIALRVKGGYSGAYGRLTKEMIAPTITRWVFHPGSGRWGHPIDFRLLTIREVARIQSFPDDFELVGSYIQQAGQLGNAVPPMLVEQIALNFAAQLRAFDLANNSTNAGIDNRSSSVGA